MRELETDRETGCPRYANLSELTEIIFYESLHFQILKVRVTGRVQLIQTDWWAMFSMEIGGI